MTPLHRGGFGGDAPREPRSSGPPDVHQRSLPQADRIPAYTPARSVRRERTLVALLPHAPALALVLALALILLHGRDGYARPRLQDDAYFYLEIARNIIETGRSEFAPGILTNGYHPLWMLTLVGAGSVFGASATILKALELGALAASFAALVWLFGIRSALEACLYVSLFWFVTGTFAWNGMETSLLCLGLVVFVAALCSHVRAVEAHRSRVLFLAALFCLATRIDAAFVLLPMLCVAPLPARAKLEIAAGLAVAGLAYAGVNQVVFGTPLPVSGLAKSLGGLQLNRAYLAQLARSFEVSRWSDKHSPLLPYAAAVATLALAVALHRRKNFPQLAFPLVVAGTLGFLLYAAKLVFGSSWVVWPWYGFPTAVSLLLAIWLIKTTFVPSVRARVCMAVAGIAVAAHQFAPHLKKWPEGFPELNRRFITEHAAALAGRTVAMGDRSGSFAFDYEGGVFQLEGLVNEADYLPVLERGGDLRPYLCRRGIALVASYESVPGDYATWRIHALQPRVTSFNGPYLDVGRSEELARAHRPARFDPPSVLLYVWQLRCPPAAGPVKSERPRPWASRTSTDG